MPSTALDVATILVLILPGFLSYRFAVWRRADPSQQSPLWQLSEIFEHTVYVHLIGVALVAAVHLLLRWSLGLTSYAPMLFQEGPNAFLKTHFTEAVLWFTLYPLYVIFFSAILGAYDVPGKVSSMVVLAVKQPANWLATSSRLLSWIPAPKDVFPQEPVWYYAFNTMSNGYTSKIPHVLVKLKSGDVYYGEIITYPIAPDIERKKDFLIRNARYYKDGFADNEQRLYENDGVGAVLLNSVNVDSIILYYEDISSLTDESGP